MGESMVTGRMPSEKKAKGTRVLQREGLNASQAVNMLFDRLIEGGDARFLTGRGVALDASAWQSAAEFVDSLAVRRVTRFDDMSKADIRVERLRSRGLM